MLQNTFEKQISYSKGNTHWTNFWIERAWAPWPYIVITFYSGQETAKGPFGLQVKLPPAHAPVYHTRRRLHTVPLIAERQAGKLWIPIFAVFGMTRPGIEPKSTASVADAMYSDNRLFSWQNNNLQEKFSSGLSFTAKILQEARYCASLYVGQITYKI